jgi:ATP-dependent helicase/nuclease subunit A
MVADRLGERVVSGASTTDWLDAADPERSAWVSANAGSGKTYTLANRVTRLLLAKAPPAKILCLTYTKAAAAEMQGRLFDQLGKWSMLADDALRTEIEKIGGTVDAGETLSEARRLFAQALETPGGLKIQTIHAFCERLLSRFPLEAGVPPSFRVLDDQTARDLLAEAREKILSRAGSGDAALADAVAYLVTQTSETRLAQILDSVTGGDRRKLEQFFDNLPRADDALLRAAETAHGAEAGETYESIAESFCTECAKEEARFREVIAWLASGKKTDGETGLALAQALDIRDAAPRFEVLRDALLKKDGDLYKSYATKALAAARPDLVDYLIALATRMQAAQERCRAAKAAALAHAALVLAGAMRETYAREKRIRGVLDYDDLISQTLHLLDSRPDAAWVLYKLDGGLDHILIDEAQDTSPEQWQIVRKLTEEIFSGEGRERGTVRTIFAVGDEKQSIFSFQGAEPEEFEANRQHFAARTGDTFANVRLETSRRSVPEVLDFVDAVFEDEAAREGLSKTPIAHTAHRASDKGRVELWPALAPQAGPELDLWRLRPVDVQSSRSPVAQLADKVAAEIAGWIKSRRKLPGHDAPIRPGDIMILMPRREPFASEVIRRLKQRDIPVAGADRMKITQQIAVMDLIALGRFALLPQDDLNLAALLRSPLIDVGEDELRTLANPRKSTLWRELQARRDETPSFTFAQAFLSDALARADYQPPYEYYSQTLVQHGMRLRLLARLGPEAADAMDEFLSLALSYEQLNTPSLEGFLHWIERGEAEVKRDMERGRDEVRVMTVHGSKGLEADIVILPDTTTVPENAGRRGEFLYTDDGVVFPVKDEEASAAVLRAKQTAKDAAMREHRRLLYVALTRAKDRLIVCGFENRTGMKEGSWYDLAARAAWRKGIPIERGDETLVVIGDADIENFEGDPRKPEDRVTVANWVREDPAPETIRPRLIRPSDAAGQEEPAAISPRGKGAARFRRGNLIHALLARLPDFAPDGRRDAALKFLTAHQVESAEAAKMADETLAVIGDPQFSAAFAPGSRAEVALVADLPELGDGARLNGRIDRLAITDDKVLAIDFKTNRPPPQTPETVSTLYLTQMALYRAALAKVFPRHRIGCALVWTEGPSLMPLPDALLDAEIARIPARLDSTRRAS